MAAPARPAAAPARPAAAPAKADETAASLLTQATAARATDPKKALMLTERGLAIEPTSVRLLFLKCNVLYVDERDYSGAGPACEAALAAGLRGAQERTVKLWLSQLAVAPDVHVTVANGPATVFFERRSDGIGCVSVSECTKRLLPRASTYRMTVERPGFESQVHQVNVQANQPVKLQIALVEKPSPVAIRVTPDDAVIMIDGVLYDPKAKIPPGPHKVTVTERHHAEETHDFVAREGKPVELAITLTPLVPVRVTPQDAVVSLAVDDKPVVVRDGHIPVPAGAHALSARAAGYKDLRVEIPAERTQDYEVVVVLAAVPPPAPPPPPSNESSNSRRTIALVVGGASVVAAGAGVVLGLQAKGLEDDSFDRCADPAEPCENAREANDLNERGRSRALQANIAYGVAAGAAVAAAVLWFTGGSESSQGKQGIAVTPSVGAGQNGKTGIDVSIRF